MLNTIFTHILAFFAAIPFSSATWFVLAVLAFFVWLFAKASQNPKSLINWEHLIVDSITDRASVYKVSYIVGMIVSTWIVITFADGGKLTFDILGTYLTYLLGGAGLNTLGKKGTPPVTDSEPDPKP